MATSESKDIGIGLFCLVNVHTISLDFFYQSLKILLSFAKKFGNINRLLGDVQ